MINIANLERKTYISPLQLAIVVFVTSVGAQIMLLPINMLTEAGRSAWMSVIIGGIGSYGAVCMMLKLGLQYPGKTLVEYMPQIWGAIGGSIVIWWFFTVIITQTIGITYGFSKVITTYMFDRTPPELVSLALLTLSIYCALQDWGTLMRVQQILCFTAYTILLAVWWLSGLSFESRNLQPLWPMNIKGILTGSMGTWAMYSGYEIVLLLLPLVSENTSFMKLAKPMLGAFGCMGFMFMSIVVLVIGVLTIETAKNSLYPSIVVIRSVELPGTFIERLENYVLVLWIPVVFDTIAMVIFISAHVCMRLWGYKDHRPFVLLLYPLLYIGNLFMESAKLFEVYGKLAVWSGLFFSFIIIPFSLLLSRWRKGKDKCVRNKAGN